MQSRPKLLAILLLFSYGIFSAGCAAGSRTRKQANLQSPTDGSTPARQPIPVDVVEAQLSTDMGELLIPASVMVENTAVVLAQREGTITMLRGEEGTRVTKGQVLASFNDEDTRAAIRQAEVEINRLKVEEKQYEALVKVNRNELERENLLVREGLSSQSNAERAQYRMETSLHELDKSRLATRGAQARLEALRIELAKSLVRAPISGIVTKRYISPGTGVTSGEKLFEVSQLAPLEVKFQLPQTEYKRLSVGHLINLSFAESNNVVAQARISRIAPIADAESSTLGYRAVIISGGRSLMPGLTLNVRLPRGSFGTIVRVPRAAFPAGGAVLYNGTTSPLFVVEGDRCAERLVVIGKTDGDQVEVISGLNVGERVILAPPSTLKPGDPVASR
jgi:RND family efflux transporter MFP subunit